MKKIRFVVLTFLCLISEMIVAEEKPPEILEPFFGSALFKSNFCDESKDKSKDESKDGTKPYCKEKFGFTIGYKGWMNNWSLPVSFANDSNQPYQQDASVLFKSDTELASMPTLNIRYHNLYLAANYFSKTKYSFGTQRIDTMIVGPGLTAIGSGNNFQTPLNPNGSASIKVPVEYIPSAERSELDLFLGYYVNRHLSLMLGYKKIDRSYNYLKVTPSVEFKGANDSKPTLYGGTTDHLYEDSQGSGMTLGITGNVPITLDGKLTLYGHFTYGLLETEVIRKEERSSSVDKKVISTTSTTKNYDSPYYSGEVGFAYQLARFKEVTLSSYLGYRFQRYEFRQFTQGGQTARDGTDGIILSFSAYF